jgi:Protein of unknown function (DUF664)
MTPTSPTAAQPTTAPAPIPDTASMLSGVAAQQRRIIGTLDGLDEATMRRSVVPSGWTFAGMVQHLTRMTSFWFDHVLSGDPFVPPPGDDFDVAPDVDVASLVEQFALAGERGPTRVADLRLDGAPAWWPVDTFGPWRLRSVFEVLHHLTVETATHSGHLDAARELVDGRTWLYELGRLSDPG